MKRNRQPVNLDELTTMIRYNEGSVTGTTTDHGTATNGSTSGSATTTPPAKGHAEHPVTPQAIASPSPVPGALKTPTGGGVGGEGTDANNLPKKNSSSKAPTAAAQEGDHKDGSPNSSGARKRGSDPPRRGGESHKRGGEGSIPKKRGSGARGIVAVEEAGGGAEGGDRAVEEEGGTGGPPEKVPRFSIQVRDHTRKLRRADACVVCFRAPLPLVPCSSAWFAVASPSFLGRDVFGANDLLAEKAQKSPPSVIATHPAPIAPPPERKESKLGHKSKGTQPAATGEQETTKNSRPLLLPSQSIAFR